MNRRRAFLDALAAPAHTLRRACLRSRADDRCRPGVEPMRAMRRRDLTAIGRFLPLIVALLGALAAVVGATAQSLPLPFAMMAVFLFLGVLASWRASARPLRGALFLLVIVAVVIGVVYGG